MKLLLFILVGVVSALQPSGVSRKDVFQVLAGGAAAVATPAVATYTGKPAEPVPKFSPKEKWNTLYPEKKLTLEKKSPVDRLDLAPPAFETYTKTYPGLTAAFGNPPK